MNVLPNLGYIPPTFPKTPKNDFFDTEDNTPEHEERCRAFMVADLAKSGLTQEDIFSSPDPFIQGKGYNDAAYLIPYHDLEGRTLRTDSNHSLMYRQRLRLTEYAPNSYGKYRGPSREQLPLLANIPYIPRNFKTESDTLYICEGEKKAVCVRKYLGLETIGIGGCHNWNDEKKSKRLHPWIKQIVERYQRVVIVPDGDVRRYDINAAYGQLAGILRRMEKEVVILDAPESIDDLIVKWGDNAKTNFHELPPLESVVSSHEELIDNFELAFRATKDGRREIHQTSSNVTKLMQLSPVFPEIWRNLDTNAVHLGDAEVVPLATEMEIANYIQHNFQMPKVTHRMVRECLGGLAARNERSPYKEWLLSLEWDGTPRLETWLSRLWGVEENQYTMQAGSRWVISSVARIMDPGCKVDWMLVTVGAQGVGKTTMPDILFDGHTVPCVGKQSDTDIKLTLHSGLCAVVDEMDALYKGESTFWKSLITLQRDFLRAPYSPSHEWKTRRFVLYGTTNVETWLPNDHSGYRRYVSIKVGTNTLDSEALGNEREQLWAEAVHRWRQGECYWEVEGASEIAEDHFAAESNVEERCLDFLEYIRATEDETVRSVDSAGGLFFTMSQFLEWTSLGGGNMARNTHLTKEVSAVLVKLGAKRVKRNGRRGYSVSR